MTFKELKKGYPVFIVKNGDRVAYFQGKVTQDATMPRVSTQYPQYLVVDVAIESEGNTKIWTLQADATSADATSGATITTDKASVLAILSSIQSDCESYLKEVDIKKQKLQDCKNLISDLDEVYKEKQQTNQRLDNLEQSISDIKDSLNEFLKQWTQEK